MADRSYIHVYPSMYCRYIDWKESIIYLTRYIASVKELIIYPARHIVSIKELMAYVSFSSILNIVYGDFFRLPSSIYFLRVK